jgi:hypothetical protein
MEYSHWLMIAGAVLVAFGFVGFAFSQNKNESRELPNARNKTAPSGKRLQISLSKKADKPSRPNG